MREFKGYGRSNGRWPYHSESWHGQEVSYPNRHYDAHIKNRETGKMFQMAWGNWIWDLVDDDWMLVGQGFVLPGVRIKAGPEDKLSLRIYCNTYPEDLPPLDEYLESNKKQLRKGELPKESIFRDEVDFRKYRRGAR